MSFPFAGGVSESAGRASQQRRHGLGWAGLGELREQGAGRDKGFCWENKCPFPAFPEEAQTKAVTLVLKRHFPPDLLWLPPAGEKHRENRKDPFWSADGPTRCRSTGVIKELLPFAPLETGCYFFK